MRAKYLGSTLGATVLWDNPATPAKGMVAKITNQYCSGIEIGDSRGAYLADTTAGTITASGELVTNGDFPTVTTGWSATSATLSVASGELVVTSDGGAVPAASQNITTVIGKTYRVSCSARKGTTTFSFGVVASGLGSSYTVSATTVVLTFDFVATSTTTQIKAVINGTPVAGETAFFDNISIKLADPDRSVKNKGLVVNGTLTKTAVASGANLVAYSGFSAANYLEQPYNADLDFGTGDFCVMGWCNPTSHPGIATSLVDRADPTSSTPRLRIGCSATNGYPEIIIVTSGGNLSATGTTTVAVGAYSYLAFVKSGTSLITYMNGVPVASTNAAAATTLTNALGRLRFGLNAVDGGSVFNGSMTLWRTSATAPSADQIAHIYRTELPLFQSNAKCTIDGTSSSVTALSYDETTDELHVGTSWGRSEFKDLLRVASETTTTGAITSLSANQGAVLTGGASSGRIYVPAYLLRDELRRKDEARAALGRMVVGQEFTATSGQTAFVIRKGYDVRFVYVNGLLKRLTTDYTVSDDAFQKTVTMTSGVPISQPVTIMITRS